MDTRRRMATPAIFVLFAVVVLFGLVTLGIVTWHLTTNANSPVAVDWGDKVCKQVPDGKLPKNCHKLIPVAVDWGDKCSRNSDGDVDGGKCKPDKSPKKVAVDWGDSMSICIPNPDGG